MPTPSCCDRLTRPDRIVDQQAHGEEAANAMDTRGAHHGDPRVITLDGFEPSHASLRALKSAKADGKGGF